MRRKKPGKKPTAYPKHTVGSAMAAKLRKQANLFTDEQREKYFGSGMALIYGGQHGKQAADARH